MTDDAQNAINELRVRIATLEADRQVGNPFPLDFNMPVSSYGQAIDSDIITSSFGCRVTAINQITMTLGKVYFKGVSKTVTDWPANGEVTISATTLYGWIKVNLATGTAVYDDGATDPGDGDDDEEIYRLFEATFADGAITGVVQCHPCDIHVPGNA